MKKIYLYITIMFLTNSLAFSNDSRTIYGSSVGIINNENTNVIMKKEIINITLFKEYYEVEVVFDFYNTGNDENILLGFPIETILQSYDRSDPEWTKINFMNYINGNIIDNYTVKEEIIKNDMSYETKLTWYLREVLFKGHEYTYSKVTYRVQYSRHGFGMSAGYIYGTGHNWKNAIGKIILNIKHTDDIIIDNIFLGTAAHDQLTINSLKKNFTWVDNGEYRFELNNIEPKLTDTIEIDVQPFDIYGKYENEFGSWSDGWIWDMYLIYNKENDLKLYTKNQIELFINFFYALHGYNFTNVLYKKYFENFDQFMDFNNTKYKPNAQFSENDFNNFERRNINYLRKIQNMIP